MNIQNIACYILANYSDISCGISPLKIQKLLYYVKAWGLVSNKNLINESFERWAWGPVNYTIYSEYKKFGKNPIDVPCKEKAPIPQEKEMIDFVLENYIEFDAITLSAMTHSEEPWIITEKDLIIPDEIIKVYYSKQHFAKNFPIKNDKEFYPVMSDMNHAFIFDMSPEDAEKSLVFSSYNEYKKLKNITKKEFDKAIKSFGN